MAELHLGDNLEVMAGMADESVDSIVTDPPAGISFMQRDWDSDKGGRDIWIDWMAKTARECLRILKPGGHALVWALPRTSHWTGTAWENAGFQPKDIIHHCFGSGFPKSQDVSRFIDKLAGAEREVVAIVDTRGSFDGHDRTSAAINTNWRDAEGRSDVRDLSKKEVTAPATDAAKRWSGFGTALKPAVEEWWLFRKPLAAKTVAANVLQYGTGAINIDRCRVAIDPVADATQLRTMSRGRKTLAVRRGAYQKTVAMYRRLSTRRAVGPPTLSMMVAMRS
jgi:hypothetical protein